jgi:hypothetical protein
MEKGRGKVMTLQRREQSYSKWLVFFKMLRETEPISGAYDVEWRGPYSIPRPKNWHRSHFMLYDGHLYGSLEIGWTTYSADWSIDSGTEYCRRGESLTATGESEELWASALPQLTRRLKSALKNPIAYNRRIQRLIPLDARTGRVVRNWTWPRGTRPPLSRKELGLLETVCERCERAAPWKSLSSSGYFRLVGRMYNAAFPELIGLSSRDQHALKADSRHSGLLNLPDEDPQAFREWFESRVWSGCHPWEIVFGHPHGILFSPLLSEDGTWRFHLSVESPGLYIRAVKMAMAIGETGAPFVLHDKNSIVAALRGMDDVEVRPSYGMLSLARLREIRPDAVDQVRWDPISDIQPITSTQKNRVEYVLRTGSPAGWEARSSFDGRGANRSNLHGPSIEK